MMQVESSNLPIDQPLSSESQLDSLQSDLCNQPTPQLPHPHPLPPPPPPLQPQLQPLHRVTVTTATTTTSSAPVSSNIRLNSTQKQVNNSNSITNSPISQECDSLLTCGNNKCIRQRQPARLLMPVKCEFNSSATRHGSSIVSLGGGGGAVNGHIQSVNQLTPPSSFWTQNRFPSASEFDTTRLNVYLNNFTKRSSFHSRNQSRIVPAGRLHHRSKSVDRTFKLASSHPALYQRGQNVIFSSSNNNNNNTNSHNNNNNINISNNNNINNNNHYADHVESTTNNLNKIVSSIRAVAINAAHRALILTRSESLQSDADSGSTSGDNDNELTTNSSVKLTEPPKSALKKSPASGSPQLTSATSKNVTFSAYTTIQVVDK